MTTSQIEYAFKMAKRWAMEFSDDKSLDFIRSIKKYYYKNDTITEKQFAVLENMAAYYEKQDAIIGCGGEDYHW